MIKLVAAFLVILINQTHPLNTTWYGWGGDRLVTTQSTTKTTTQTSTQTDERTSSTLYEPNSFVPMIRIDTTNQRTSNADGSQQQKTHQAKAFYHCNHLGTPLALIDVETAKLIWQAEFDPWGLMKGEYNPYNIDQPIRMQGQQRDRETGLFYNRYRYYLPRVGRYVQADPIGLKGGINTYSYVNGNPVNDFDSLGLMGGGGNHASASCNCPTPPAEPQGACIADNINIAKDYSAWNPGAIAGLYENVKNHGVWDYKRKGSQYEDFGNFNYGAITAAMGIGSYIAQMQLEFINN